MEGGPLGCRPPTAVDRLKVLQHHAGCYKRCWRKHPRVSSAATWLAGCLRPSRLLSGLRSVFSRTQHLGQLLPQILLPFLNQEFDPFTRGQAYLEVCPSTFWHRVPDSLAINAALRWQMCQKCAKKLDCHTFGQGKPRSEHFS